ncbi:hypothetical protein [Citrobacter portucalensis]|uniref:hypothetical protein n=1 Tax=Citrobacter portucalensis TaxID=1639133 RepID=UPI0028892D40|nr:hypothetical protein [Citrobacter portucalensis]WNI84115.1 hypothetical protein RIK60_00235 [Citrobacter portucalensis]
MPIIVTNNHFLKIALKNLDNINENVILIDIEFCQSAKDLLFMMSFLGWGRNKTKEIIFLGGGGRSGKSGITSLFKYLNINLSFEDFRARLVSMKGISFNVVRERIRNYRSLSCLTKDQVAICILCCKYKVSKVSELTGKSSGAIFNQLYYSCRKMQFTSLAWFLNFLLTEFRGAEIRSMLFLRLDNRQANMIWENSPWFYHNESGFDC